MNPTDTTQPEIIDVGGPTEPIDLDSIPHIRVHLAGHTYTAYCPKDMVWLEILNALANNTATAIARALFGFLDGAFHPDTSTELATRWRSLTDPLNYEDWIEPTTRQLIKTFTPVITEQLTAMGMSTDDIDTTLATATQQPTPTPVSRNRAQRRAAKKTTPKPKTTRR